MLPVFPGSHSDTVPPDSIPNSEVKRISADGSVGFPHVRVGHCQVPFKETRLTAGFLRLEETKNWGQSTLIPNFPFKTSKWGQSTLILLILLEIKTALNEMLEK